MADERSIAPGMRFVESIEESPPRVSRKCSGHPARTVEPMSLTIESQGAASTAPRREIPEGANPPIHGDTGESVEVAIVLGDQ